VGSKLIDLAWTKLIAWARLIKSKDSSVLLYRSWSLCWSNSQCYSTAVARWQSDNYLCANTEK